MFDIVQPGNIRAEPMTMGICSRRTVAHIVGVSFVTFGRNRQRNWFRFRKLVEIVAERVHLIGASTCCSQISFSWPIGQHASQKERGTVRC
jgi:hypothetical protein